MLCLVHEFREALPEHDGPTVPVLDVGRCDILAFA